MITAWRLRSVERIKRRVQRLLKIEFYIGLDNNFLSTPPLKISANNPFSLLYNFFRAKAINSKVLNPISYKFSTKTLYFFYIYAIIKAYILVRI